MARQFLQAVQVVGRQKIIYVGQRRLHPPRQGLVAGRAEQRIEPDEPVAAALQARHFPPQQFRLAPVPAVGYDQNHRPATQHAPRPAVVEHFNGLPDAGAAGPVRHGARHFAHRLVNAPVRQVAGNAGQPRGEQKRLQLLPAGGHGVDEMQQHPGVAFHRPADIADQSQGAGFGLAPPAGQFQHFAAVGQAAAHRAAQVDGGAGFAPGLAAGAAAARIPGQFRHQRAGRPDFRWRIFGKVALPEDFASAEGTLQVNYGLAIAGFVRAVIVCVVARRAVRGILPVGRHPRGAVAPFLAH